MTADVVNIAKAQKNISIIPVPKANKPECRIPLSRLKRIVATATGPGGMANIIPIKAPKSNEIIISQSTTIVIQTKNTIDNKSFYVYKS